MTLLRAYVLVNVAPHYGPEVNRSIRCLEAVRSSDLVTGPHDLVVMIEGNDLNEIADLVVSKILTIAGVVSTSTCLGVEREVI